MAPAPTTGSGKGDFPVERLAFGADLPVVAINTLEAMAEACHRASGALAVMPMLDARMGEVYWAEYAFDRGLVTVIAPRLTPPGGVLAQGAVQICGNAMRTYPDQFTHLSMRVASQVDLMPHAEHIARLGLMAFAAGQQVAARDAQPLYLRNNVALTTAERLAKSRQALS